MENLAAFIHARRAAEDLAARGLLAFSRRRAFIGVMTAALVSADGDPRVSKLAVAAFLARERGAVVDTP